MSAQDAAGLSARAALAAQRDGSLSAEALARACLARVQARDAEVRAWAALDPAQVLAQARAIDELDELDKMDEMGERGAQQPRTALHGLPIGIKDVILTADLPTQYNSPLHSGFHPRIDAACVRLLRHAGALVFGKTTTVEFGATGHKPPTRNPHDLRRTPGGSSSGSAAAVADGQVPLALGTQTGGSVLRPASYCGVWAIKPTWGLVSNEGCKAYAPSLDTLGWFARSAADLALLYGVFDPEPEPEPAGAAAFTLAGARIALCRTPMWRHATPATQGAMASAAAQLRAAGAQVSELALPDSFDALPAQQLLLMRAEGRATLLCEYREHPQLLEPSLRDQVLNTDRSTREQLRQAHLLAAAGRAAWDGIAAAYDAVLVPSATGEAPMGLASTGDFIFNGLWTLLHAPCINVPGWAGPAGMPVGLTLAGPRYADRRLLAVARAMQTELQL